jgi:O-antigen ligase
MNAAVTSFNYPVAAKAEVVQLSGFRRCLLLSAVASLPFCYAGTINLGFPLKYYEVAIGVLLLLHIFNRSSHRQSQLVLIREERRVLNLAVAFLAVAVLSSVSGYFVLANVKTTIIIDSWRHDPMVASILKCGYVLLDIFALSYVIGAKTIRIETICNWWFLGAVLACLYGWYLFAFSMENHAVLVLPGQDYLQTGGPVFPQAIRGGTFLEGNFVATFYLTSLVLAVAMFCRTWKFRYVFLALVFLVSFIPPQSTTGLISVIAFILILLFLIAISSQKGLIISLPIIIACAIGLGSAYDTDYVQAAVVDKITNDTDQGSSRSEREDSIISAFEMFEDYPVLGVGLSNFGFLYPFYTQSNAQTLDLAAQKNITNNIYSEVSTETGVVGSVVFLSFCGYLLLLYRKGSRGLVQKVMLAGLAALFVAWMAYPTFSILFQWVFFGLAVRIFLEGRKENA